MKKRINFSLHLSLILGLSLSVFLGLLLPSASDPQSADPVVTTGQTSTLLPNGHWLMMGGEGTDGPLAAAFLWDPITETTTPVTDDLEYARAWHTATLLPDGNVLILGGVGADGLVVDVVEFFDPVTGTFAQLSILNSSLPTARAYHTATLLTEGRVLIATGVSNTGQILDTAELWDTRTQTTEILTATLSTARHSHTASLQSDGSVLLWGGVDANSAALDNGERYDPATQDFTSVGTYTSPSDAGVPELSASLPDDEAVDVPVGIVIALRFSEALLVETINENTMTLTGFEGPVAANVIPAEEGMLAFITPEAPLLPGGTYILLLDGPTDRTGFSLPWTSITFTTTNDLAPDSDDWIPDAEDLQGNWKIDLPESPWQSLPPLEAAPGVTALAGQVLKLNGDPLANVILQIENLTVQTDDTGRFLLQGITSGQHVLVIDGRTANRSGKTYGVFEVGESIVEGMTNVLPYTIWMPKIDTSHAVTISSPTTAEVAVTTPRIPGLEVRIPPETVIRDRDGQVVTSVSITPIPVDRTPFPLPAGVKVPVYFTLQPGGANLETLNDTIPHGARVIYPNYTNLSPGSRGNFWNYEPGGLGWYVYGQGTVTPNRQQVVPDLGVAIYKFTGTMFNENGPSVPSTAPAAGNDTEDGDPVDLGTGLIVMSKTDLYLPDVLPIELTRTYRQSDMTSRPFGIGTTHPYAIFLNSADQSLYQEVDLILPDGGKVHYVRISTGTGWTDAVFEHTASPTIYYKSQISWNGAGWDLELKDGTLYVFRDNPALLTSIQDRYGNTLAITRDSSRRVTMITSPHGRWLEFTYDVGDRITEARDNIGRTVLYTYDASGRLTTVTDTEGGMTQYTYDASHQMQTIQDARGIIFLDNDYDANGRVIKQTQADTTTYDFAYVLDGNGQVTQADVTDPNGNVRRVTFNSDGYTLTDTRALGTPEAQTTTYQREAGTNLVQSVTDAMGRETAYAYDGMGNVTSITKLSGTAEAVTTTFTYEPTFNQVETITDPLNHTTTFSYDSNGNLATITDPLGNPTMLVYNASGQPLSVTDPLNNTTQFTYDLGDLISVTDPFGNNTTRFIDAAGRLISLTNQLGNITRYDYDALNRLTKVTDALNGITQFVYDGNGNLLSVTDARSGLTTYTYDLIDRLDTRADPLLSAESYDYDGNGNLTQFADREGQTTAFTYDSLNRRIFAGFKEKVRGNKTTYESTIDYTYDAGNRLTQVDDSASGIITLTYDNLDRLSSETTPHGTVSYAYDDAGRRTSMTVAGQPTVSYTYDDANRLTQITQGTSIVVIGYDAVSRRTSLTLPNGVVVDYSYDAASRVTGITYSQGVTELGSLTYAYDAAGSRTEIGGTWARTGLPQAVSSATYNAANQLTNWNGTNLSYDANGNLANDGANTYTWNARNQLASMTGASFVYDPLGRRMSKTVSGTTTEFLYDGVNPVQELSGGTPTANLLTGLGIDEYFIRTDTMGTETLLTDALGSTMALADSTGTVLTEYTYEPFGRTVFAGAPSDNAFQYTGRENDNTGLYYYRARYYSPTLQRFISEDPLGVAVNPFLRIGANHLYAFAENNPIRFTDPTGLAVWVCNRKTDWGVGNHAYLWDDRRAGRSCGMRGSSNRGGTSGTNDGGPSVDSCRRISGSNGMEDELMRCCEETANRGAWFPPINDCHEAVDDCIRGSNLKNPGAPGGRIGKPCELCDNK